MDLVEKQLEEALKQQQDGTPRQAPTAKPQESREKQPDEIISEIIKERDEIQKSRQFQERQWLVNLAFLAGKQHFVAERKTGAGLEERIIWELKAEDRKNKTRRTSNYILPLFRSQLARLLAMKSHVTVDPLTGSDRDKAAARVGEEVLEDHFLMVNKSNPTLVRKMCCGMQLLQAKLFKAVLTTGKAYLYPYWNPSVKGKTYMAGSVVDSAQPIGEIETKVRTQFDVFEDRLGQFVIDQEVMAVSEIKKLYDKDVQPEDIELSDAEQQILNMLEGASEEREKYKNAARVYRKWEGESDKHPDGHLVICTSKEILYDGSIPTYYKGVIPLFGFDYFDFLLSSYPQSMIEPLISLQEEYNFTITRLHQYKKFFAGKLKVPKKCKLETKYDTDVGQIIFYESGYGEPHFETPPGPPAFLMEELIRIRKDMEDTAAVHDSAMGRLPQEIKSGVAIENLNELDQNQLTPVALGIEVNLGFYCETILNMAEKLYVEPRLRAIAGGDEESADVAMFKGSDLAGHRRIKVNVGSSLPASKENRQLFIMKLKAEGYIDEKKALELMEFGDLAGVYKSIDENAQRVENAEMLKGTEVLPTELDHHQTHIYIIEKYMKGENFKKLDPQIAALFWKHRKLHQEFLRMEMATARNMNAGGGAGGPAAAPTPGPQGSAGAA